MAENDTVRGLKGTITKQKEEIARLEVAVGDERRLRLSSNEALQAVELELISVRAIRNEESARRQRVEKELEVLLKSERDALLRLHVAEKEVARLTGYIQRVGEDDAARDGFIERTETAAVPRRRAPPIYSGSVNMATDANGRPW